MLWCVLALAALGCSSGTASGNDFVPKQKGQLTVATANVPAPGFWEGTPEAVNGGFEWELANELADRFALDKVNVVVVPFGAIAGGDLGDADFALTQMTPTDERREHVDFSTPYLTAAPGVLVRRGITAEDHEDLKELRWVVLDVSTLTPIVNDIVRPDDPPLVVKSRTEQLDALRADRADAVLFDLPVAQGIARDQADVFAVAGQLTGQEGLSVVLPNQSPNGEIIDSTIRALRAGGDIDDLTEKWFGTEPLDVPLIRVDD